MDRFKFRMWEIKENKYRKESIVDLQAIFSLSEPSDYFIIEQCTGLKAKKSYRGTKENDLLIFEGDIVFATWKTYVEKAEIVNFCNYGWAIDMGSKYYPKCKEGWVEMINSNMKFEIIGTIHDKDTP